MGTEFIHPIGSVMSHIVPLEHCDDSLIKRSLYPTYKSSTASHDHPANCSVRCSGIGVRMFDGDAVKRFKAMNNAKHFSIFLELQNQWE